MRVLDLFAGLGGWSSPFAERGHEVVTVDNDPRFGCTYTADILEWESEGEFDIVLASPPCESFSILTIPKRWLPGYVPKDHNALAAIALVERTVSIIENLEPAFWIVENPRAMLRKVEWQRSIMSHFERRTVTYCQYGSPWRKPTDLWGGFPPSLELRRMCRNGDACHIAAARGSRTGVQSSGPTDDLRRWVEAKADDMARPDDPGTDGGAPFLRVRAYQSRLLYGTWNQATWAAERAKIPAELALDVCLAAERDSAAGLVAADYTGRLFA